MKRKRILKNIIMILVILVSCGLVVFTMNYAKNHVTSTNKNDSNVAKEGANNTNNTNSAAQNNDNNNANGGTQENNQNNSKPPEMPNNNANGSNGQSSNPPEKPEGDSSNESQNNNSDQTKTEMKDSNSNQDSTSSSDNSGESKSNNDNVSNNQGMPNNMQSNMPSENEKITLSWQYYIIFIALGSIITGLVIYLIASKLNKKTFKEVFYNKDKTIIKILLFIMITYGFSMASILITNKCFLKSDASSNNNMSSNSVNYSATTSIKSNKTITSGSYKSTTNDQNAILASGSIKTSMSNISVSKTGDSDGGDSTSFYGNNSAILAKDGASVTLKNVTVKTNSTGSNGVFSYGGSATTTNNSSDGTTINIKNSKITTEKDNSGGIMVTGGGVLNAVNLTINTKGTSSAAIRSDRGGGTMTVNKGSYTTTGKGSPTIYSTANIKVSNAKLTATSSEGVVIEGKNSVSLNNVTLTDTNNQLNGKSTTYKNIFLYQSMSGDASEGTANFTAKNSKITTNKGDTFYITNTTAKINLENNTIVNNDSEGNFLRAQKDSWGNDGSNGGNVTLTLKKQKVTGNIVIDSVSTLSMKVKTSSYYEGTINGANTAKSIKLSLSKNSKIKLTGDSYVTSLDNEDSTNSNIDFNGYKLYVNGVAIN